MENKKHEILALAALTITVLIACALISYDAHDPTLFNTAGPDHATRNMAGVFGSHLAWPLIYALGAGAYGIVVLGVWITIAFFRKINPFTQQRIQLAGLVLLLFTCVTLASLNVTRITIRGQEMLSGGMAGHSVAALLMDTLHPIGSHILLTALLLVGLMLATPFSFSGLARGSAKAGGTLVSGLAAGASRIKNGLPRRGGDDDDDEEEEIEASPQAPKPARKPSRKRKGKEPPPRDLTADELVPETLAPGNDGAGPNVKPGQYVLPPLELLNVYQTAQNGPDPETLEQNSRILEEKLRHFGVQGQVVGVMPGPVITMYEYTPAPGVKISRIVNLADDLAMALKALSIRVVAPIPGKGAIGIELPNPKRNLVPLRPVMEEAVFAKNAPLTIALGQDTTGKAAVANLAKMPHLLIAGATGTGKSVCINSVLCGLLCRNTPEDLRLLLVDPKRIELKSYQGIPQLIHPVVTDAKVATRALKWAVGEMELRYELLADRNARNIEGYNEALIKDPPPEIPENEGEGGEGGENVDDRLRHHRLPYIVIVIDELADLMMVASRDVEESITRLAQMARAAGIHLILATQRPSVDVLTGIIKANFPTRISFQVSSKVDSRTVIDTIGAEALLGMGDMLFMPPGTAKLQRIHGAFISETEVEKITNFWRAQEMLEDAIGERVVFEESEDGEDAESDIELDEKYEEAVKLVLKTRHASISMLQRRLRVGYNRAARMIEVMEQRGLVTPSDGAKPREVIGPREI